MWIRFSLTVWLTALPLISSDCVIIPAGASEYGRDFQKYYDSILIQSCPSVSASAIGFECPAKMARGVMKLLLYVTNLIIIFFVINLQCVVAYRFQISPAYCDVFNFERYFASQLTVECRALHLWHVNRKSQCFPPYCFILPNQTITSISKCLITWLFSRSLTTSSPLILSYVPMAKCRRLERGKRLPSWLQEFVCFTTFHHNPI